ncbi:MAG: heptaprenyl diphosphate synthase [Epulopiscium sp. Nuni2H_MBin003]|nr:MAG: heptaprenyl diphosphate synthase [Epulopiscium sp. Nuni2H_MBin003]
MSTSKITYLGVMVTIALIFSYIEFLIPIKFPVPGIKLGLANVVILVILYKMGWKAAFWVSTIRVVISGFLFGNPMMILFSLVGCTLSLFSMTLIYKKDSFSIMGVSMLGAVMHNLGQVLVAMIVMESFSVIYYFISLLIAALFTGFVIGIIAQRLLAINVN